MERMGMTFNTQELSILYSALTMRCVQLEKALDQFTNLGWNDFKERAHIEYARTKELRARVHGGLYNTSGKTFEEQ